MGCCTSKAPPKDLDKSDSKGDDLSKKEEDKAKESKDKSPKAGTVESNSKDDKTSKKSKNKNLLNVNESDKDNLDSPRSQVSGKDKSGKRSKLKKKDRDTSNRDTVDSDRDTNSPDDSSPKSKMKKALSNSKSLKKSGSQMGSDKEDQATRKSSQTSESDTDGQGKKTDDEKLTFMDSEQVTTGASGDKTAESQQKNEGGPMARFLETILPQPCKEICLENKVTNSNDSNSESTVTISGTTATIPGTTAATLDSGAIDENLVTLTIEGNTTGKKGTKKKLEKISEDMLMDLDANAKNGRESESESELNQSAADSSPKSKDSKSPLTTNTAAVPRSMLQSIELGKTMPLEALETSNINNIPIPSPGAGNNNKTLKSQKSSGKFSDSDATPVTGSSIGRMV